MFAAVFRNPEGGRKIHACLGEDVFQKNIIFDTSRTCGINMTIMKKQYMKRLWPLLLLLAALILLIDFLAAWGEAGQHPDKIWLHRCNSIEKLQEKHAKFPNFEVDVVYTPQGRFDVTHELSASVGLGLERYFQQIRTDSSHVWIDVKNLSASNCSRMLNTLDSLTRCYDIDKRRLIVESGDWRSLAAFRRRGYYTSYYISYPDPSSLSERELNRAIRHIRQVADSRCVSALSFPGWWYATLKRRLNRSIDLLTWEHRRRRIALLMLPRGRRMLANPQLKVILVKDKGNYHR